MAISEKRRLAFTTVAVILMGAVSAFLLLGALPPSTAATPVLPPDYVQVYIRNNTLPTYAASSSATWPPNINVPAGTTVLWTNRDQTTHTVTSLQGLFDSGGLSAFSYTFTESGVYDYRCTIHGMVGIVTVS